MAALLFFGIGVLAGEYLRLYCLSSIIIVRANFHSHTVRDKSSDICSF